MHIPDGFISWPINLSTGVTSALFLGYALRESRTTLEEYQIPLMGVTAAFVFAAQMLNFPVGAGTSGHFLGAFFTMVLLGAFPGMVVMTTVLTLQAFMFADGGFTALGTNVFNMAMVGGLLVYGLFAFTIRLVKPSRKLFLVLAGLFAWLSVLLASLAAAVQISLSGLIPFGLSLTAMGSVHALIGIGEGLITAAALSLLITQRPDLIHSWPHRGGDNE